MKKILGVLILVSSLVFLAACGDNDAENQVINIGATAIPHAEILAQVAPILEEQGYTLNIIEFHDFTTPNIALQHGDIDINFFQHVPFLNNFNYNHETNLVPVFGVHFEPLRLFSLNYTDLSGIENATIAIPDDPTNESRALLLLEDLGLISSQGAYNPHNLTILPIAADLLARTLEDVDYAVINGNFALLGGVTHLAIDGAGEEVGSEAATTFTNFIVVRHGYEENSAVLALINAINSQYIRDFINNTYYGRVVPTF